MPPLDIPPIDPDRENVRVVYRFLPPRGLRYNSMDRTAAPLGTTRRIVSSRKAYPTRP